MTIKFRNEEATMKKPSNLGDGETIMQLSNLDMEKQQCNPRSRRCRSNYATNKLRGEEAA
uniref:Uncharacterized protein n=1 Tax=Cucumis melo TaxID=3656 RepID=A0A9I9DK37_CUCME